MSIRLEKVRNLGNAAENHPDVSGFSERVSIPVRSRGSCTKIKAAAILHGSTEDMKDTIKKPAEFEALPLVFVH